MFSENEWFILIKEFRFNLLIKIHTMSSNWNWINSFISTHPMLNSTIMKNISISSQENTLFSIIMNNLCELTPICCLMRSRKIFIRHNSKINIFNWEFELIHKHFSSCSVNSRLLIFMNSNEWKSNSFNI